MSTVVRTASALRDLARRPLPEPRDDDRCELCAEPVPAEHRHLLDTTADTLLCACRACALLFDTDRHSGGRRPYLLISERRRRLDGMRLDARQWAALRVPVGLAFFLRGGPPDDEITAGYPGPMGVVRAPVDRGVWAGIEAGRPDLGTLVPRTEALLVNRAGGSQEHWIVPLDDCYRLAALLRTHWSGLAGGDEVWQHVRQFFDQLTPVDPDA
ncbi:DUF5947 family protein [Streptomyces sp. NRRL S-1448]|uniref:DUF5947 family protein n=1 Tax=Streptomyces sp. NRRL S-1448 TaxID=1463883 RepID=UPI0004C24105|nr:DUF5947 family protein [Streptomyces sp. NRRL S-1448]